MKRKIIKFLIAFFIIWGIIMIFTISSSRKNKNQQNQPDQVFVSNPPEISSFFPKKEGLSDKINVDSVETPDKLPLIKVSPPKAMSEDDVLRIAKASGFGSNFDKLVNGEGQRLYNFKTDDAYMTVYADTAKLSYRSYTKISNKNIVLKDQEIIAKAKDFLINKFSLPENQINFSFMNNFSNDELVDPANQNQPSTYFEVNFSPVTTKYKILTTSPNQSPIKVWVAGDGTIGKAEITLTYNVELTSTEYSIKNFDDIKNDIKNATVVRAYTEDSHGQTFPPNSISSITINKIEIVYLAELTGGNDYYQPVFLLEGTGKSSVSQKTITVSLYLPALK